MICSNQKLGKSIRIQIVVCQRPTARIAFSTKPPYIVPRPIQSLDATDVSKVYKVLTGRVGHAVYVYHFIQPICFRYLTAAVLENRTPHITKPILFNQLHPLRIKAVVQVVTERSKIVIDGSKTDSTLPFQKSRHFGTARLKLVDIGKIEQVFVLMRIIQKIHDRKTEIIRIRPAHAADIENTSNNKNSVEIARNNSIAQIIKADRTFSGAVCRKLVRFRKNVVEKEILYGNGSRSIGAGNRPNDKIEIGFLSKFEEIASGHTYKLRRHGRLYKSGRTALFKLHII